MSSTSPQDHGKDPPTDILLGTMNEHYFYKEFIYRKTNSFCVFDLHFLELNKEFHIVYSYFIMYGVCWDKDCSQSKQVL